MSTPDRLTIGWWMVQKRGFSIIPVEPRGKRPVTTWKAFQLTHPSLDNLQSWLRTDSSRNLGIVCGAISGVVVIDCDSPAAIVWADGHLPATPMRTITARGEHRFYRHPGSPVSNAAHIRTGDGELALDIRGDGGYVVAPGSIHESGFIYTRAGTWPPVDQLPMFNHAWIAETPPPDAERATDRETLLARVREYLLEVPPAIQGTGGDVHTYRLCCKLVRGFALTDDEAFDLLQPWNARCQPRWSDAELRDKLFNARTYGDEPIGGRRDAPRPGDPVAPPRTPLWPAPLGRQAYSGLLGDIVQTIAPETESDPVGLLLQMLVMLGNIIGRSAHFVVEACSHYLNEFVLLVGNTSKARKGTSFEYGERLFQVLDPHWMRVSGLSSGEGLIWSVRDPVIHTSGKKIVDVDEGVIDKRLLVFESELASTLHMMERTGNTLGDVMKNAWDGRPLGTLTKKEPTRATGAHVSVVAHVTTTELLRYLTRTEMANGWANRFLVACVQRARVLPLGGQVIDLTRFRSALAEVVQFASTRERTEPMNLDAAAEARWCAVYPRLSADRPGLVGAMNARAEAHARRLAALYAVTDKSPVVGLPHLDAALEIMRYVLDSLVYIFGDSLGDSTADTLLAAVRAAPTGLTRTEISNLFSRHRSDDVARALALLVTLQLIVRVQEATGGRPVERWRAWSDTDPAK